MVQLVDVVNNGHSIAAVIICGDAREVRDASFKNAMGTLFHTKSQDLQCFISVDSVPSNREG